MFACFLLSVAGFLRKGYHRNKLHCLWARYTLSSWSSHSSCIYYCSSYNPIASMHGSIVTYISHKDQPHIGKYSIHGWYGYIFIYYTICLFCGVLIVLKHVHRQSELRHIPLGISSFATVESLHEKTPKS